MKKVRYCFEFGYECCCNELEAYQIEALEDFEGRLLWSEEEE